MNTPLSPLTGAEITAITSASQALSAADAGRNGMTKLATHIMRAREVYGYSEADICEALSDACEYTDVSKYTFRVLEYVFRYTTKYGAALVVVLGTYTVLEKAASAASSLFNLIFGSSDSTEKDKYVRDKVVRDNWFVSGVSQADLVASLRSALDAILPPGMGALVKKFTSGNGGNSKRPGSDDVGSSEPDPVSKFRTAFADATRRDARVRDEAIRPGNLGIARRRI